jgi:hypothetical protein
MQTVRVIVCERTGKWASALRVLVPLPRTAICETRGLAECRVRLRESPASLIVVESTPENWLDVCRWLPLQTGQFANMRAVIVAEPVLRGAECLLRTAGAHHLVDSLAGLGGLSRWICAAHRPDAAQQAIRPAVDLVSNALAAAQNGSRQEVTSFPQSQERKDEHGRPAR